MTRVAIYARVSTAEQAEEGYSIGAQTDRLTAYCMARDWLIYDTYIDAGYSGSNTERPALKKLIHDIKNKKIDLVLVYKLDRLSRSQKDTLLLIEDVFNHYDVSFVSINENFDTSTPFGRAMIGMLSVFAQLEREQIKERSRMGRIERAKEGLFHGGGFTPIGYDYVEGELKINDYEAMQVREIFSLFLSGRSISSIQRHMNKKYTHKHGSWHSSTSIVSVLTTPLYKGKIQYLGEIYEGQHQPIVDEKTFDQAYRIYDDIRWNKDGTKDKKNPFVAKNILTGLLMCGNCSARYYVKGNYGGHGDNKKYHPYYTCYSRGKSNKPMIKDPTCKNPSHHVGSLDNVIIEQIKKLSFDPSVIAQMQADSATIIPSNNNAIIEEKIKALDKQINRLLDLYQMGTMPFDNITDRIEKLNDDKELLISQLSSEDVYTPVLTIEDAKDLLIHAHDVLDSEDTKKKREFIHSLINEIIVYKDDIEIHWAFE
ncbi:MAG: recombinase family protein [Erysipelotrichia bacterium]|jgi:site-specific DNA recombinase|nr:recombinase family protein [Erysipelotrichia bacterium]